MKLKELNEKLKAVSPRLWAVRSGGDTVVLYEEATAPTGVNPFRGPICKGRYPLAALRLFEGWRKFYGF